MLTTAGPVGRAGPMAYRMVRPLDGEEQRPSVNRKGKTAHGKTRYHHVTLGSGDSSVVRAPDSVAGSNPCRNGGRIFFFRVNFLC